MPAIYGAIDLQKNELRNAVVQNLGGAPSSPVKGQLYFNSTGGDNTLYWYDGTGWIPAKASSTLPLSNSASALVVGGAASGGAASDASRGDHVHSLPGWGAVSGPAAFGAAKADGSAATFSRSDHSHGLPAHDNAAHAAVSLSALAVPTTALSMNNYRISNLDFPVGDNDATNKLFVESLVSGLSWKEACFAATTANITLSGLQTIDGVALTSGVRVLVKNQTNAVQNGIYDAIAGGWTRSVDAQTPGQMDQATVFVSTGTTQADTGWTCTTDAPVPGTSVINFAQFSGTATLLAGAGLTKTGNTVDVVAGDTSLTVAADSVIVNTAVIATRAYVDTSAPAGLTKKYAAALSGTASPETVVHNLNTRDIHLTVLNGGSPYTAVEVDWDATTVNSAVVRYSPNLGAGYRVVVIG